MASIKYTNNAKTTLAADLNNSATSATVVNGNLFPSLSSGEHFYCTFDDGTNTEIVKVTARSTHVLTIVRAQDNTSARAFSSGDKAELRITAVVLEEVSTSTSSWNTDIFAGDGSDTTFTLTQAATDEKYLQVYIDGAFQAHNTYSVSGTTLTFATAPANSRVITVYHIEPVALGTATGATITANNSANETVYPTFVDGATGTQGLETDTGLTYNPSTGMLTSTGFTGALTGNASTATILATARTIGGVSFNGSANIDLPGVNTAGNQNTSGLAATATALATARTIHGVSFDGTANIDLSEVISDTVGAMVSSNTESGITVAYQDADNTLDFTIGTLNQNTTGSAATLTTARTIGGTSFDGSANIAVALAATATTLATARTIHGVSFDGSANIDLTEVVQDTVGAMVSSNTESGITVAYQDSDGTLDFTVGTLNQDTTGTAATVTGAAQTNITSLGTLTTLTVDDITINGSTISDAGALDITSGADFTVDSAADINLDAGGGDWRLKDDGTTICTISNVSGDLQLLLGTQDKDFKFQVNDGGSQLDALVLDASLSGQAVALKSARIGEIALVDGTTAWDAAAAANATLVLEENTTISAPSNAVAGAIISIEVAQHATSGPYTLAWNTVFEFAASTAPTMTATDAKTDIFSFRYNGSVWQEIGRVQNLAQT